MTIHCNQPEVDGPDCECLLDLESVCDFECAVLLDGVCFWCKTPTVRLVKLGVLGVGDQVPISMSLPMSTLS
jgi:hypothetical protein